MASPAISETAVHAWPCSWYYRTRRPHGLLIGPCGHNGPDFRELAEVTLAHGYVVDTRRWKISALHMEGQEVAARHGLKLTDDQIDCALPELP